MTDLKIYTIEELEELLHVTRRTIYNYIKSGALHASKIGKYWRVTEDNLKEFLENGYSSQKNS